MWQKILVPHDFSQCAARALEVAARLAEVRGGQVFLVHVSPLPPNLPFDAQVVVPGSTAPASIDQTLIRGASQALATIAAPLQQRGLSVHVFARATEPGSPAAAILRIADELGADVIVLGTHGRTGFAHLLLGSVAEQVIRRARVPVLSVRSEDEAPHLSREEELAEDETAG